MTTTDSTPTGTPETGSRLVSGRSRRGEKIIRVVLGGAAMVSVLTTTLIILSLVRETISFLGEVPLPDFLFGTEWSPLFADANFGVLPLLAGTMLTTVIALLVAIPLGLAAAVYLSEYASPRVRGTLKPILELLAGVPTVVFGYFALTFITPILFNDVLGMKAPVFNALSAGLIMGFMVLPTIASLAEDAMSAVPQSLREGAYGLGANRMQVSTRVVFPPRSPASLRRGARSLTRRRRDDDRGDRCRAGAQPHGQPRIAVQTMTAFIAAVAKGDAAVGSIAYQTLFAVGMLLFLITLALNTLSIRFVRRFRQVY